MKVNVNGAILDPAAAMVPALDHGFLFGDSVYETLRAYGGCCFRQREHLTRLSASAAALALRLPVHPIDLMARCQATLAAAGLADAAVRVVVTRGVGLLELDPRSCGEPNVLIYARTPPRYPARAHECGVPVAVVSRTRNSPLALDPNVKSGNYLNNVLAQVEARETGAFEAIMLTADGRVTEASTSNVFIVSGARVLTPPVTTGLLSGVTRAEVLAACGRLGIEAAEADFTAHDLRAADEAFLTSSLKQVLAISQVDGEAVGGGGAGPITLKLLRAYRDAVRAETGHDGSV